MARATARSSTSSRTTSPAEGPSELAGSAATFGGADASASCSRERDFVPDEGLEESPWSDPPAPAPEAPGTSLEDPKLFSDL